MDWCVTFPRESCIIYRPSLRKACGDNRSAAKFLSYLLYRASIREESKSEAKHLNEVRRQHGLEPDQDESITICRTQSQIIREMDDEISVRTLRDEAIPCLIELGYLKTEEFRGKLQYTAYTVLPEAIQEGINHTELVPHFKTMSYYLKAVARKNCRTEKFPNGSEKLPSAKLEGVGKIADPKSTDKPAPQEALGTIESSIRLRDSNREKERKSLTDLPSISLSSDEQSFYDLWSQMPFNVIAPKVTQTLIGHCAELAPHIQTLEQLKSLVTFAREHDHVPVGKDVKLGNLVNSLNGWLQVQSRMSQPQNKPISLAERNRLNREKYGIGK